METMGVYDPSRLLIEGIGEKEGRAFWRTKCSGQAKGLASLEQQQALAFVRLSLPSPIFCGLPACCYCTPVLVES